MKNEYAFKRTIPNILNAFKETDSADLISNYENIIISMCGARLLFFGSIINFTVRYFLQSQGLRICLLDSMILLLLGTAFEIIARIKVKTNIATLIISILTSFTFVCITFRFYYIIGAAVWSIAFIQIMLAMIRITKEMLYCLLFTLLISNIYIFYQIFFCSSYSVDIFYNILQISLFCVQYIIAAVAHKINGNRCYKIEMQLQEMSRQKEEITILYKKIAASENETKATLEKLKKTQEQLVQQEKLAGIGQLAAGVAHEINNPLGYISSNFETSRNYFTKYREIIQSYKNFIVKLPRFKEKKFNLKIQRIQEMEKRSSLDFINEDLESLFDDIEDGIKRINEIVTGLKWISRVDDFGDYDLNAGIKNTLIVAKNEIKHHARVVEVLKDIPFIQAKGSQINQVLLNIIMNAIYAIKVKESETYKSIMISTNKVKEYVRCEIEDNGIGIEEKDINNIFNAFFTTKPIGQGTGLGLSIAYDIIVNGHGGKIYVESSLGVGTKFTIMLPIRQKANEKGEKL